MDLNPTFVCAKKAHTNLITQIAFSEKGNQLASCSCDTTTKVQVCAREETKYYLTHSYRFGM